MWRNPRRLALTLSGVAVSVFLLIILQVLLRGLTDPTASPEAASRVVVRHQVSLANMLFAKYQPRIERIPGVEEVSRILWFGGIYIDEKNFFPQFACDPARIFKIMSEVHIEPDQLQRFVEERAACVVGIQTMERFGWQLGDRIQIMGAMWPCNLELTVRGVYSGSFDETHLYFHHDYLDELLGEKGFTGLFWVKVRHPDQVPEVMERIDAEFANSDAETTTETERSFQIGFVSMLGNIKMLIGSVTTVIVFTLVLVTAGTMSMTVRERVREIAILKTLGFGRLLVFGMILSESFGLAMVGGLTGCAGAWALLSTVDFYKLSRGLFVSFEITPHIVAFCLLIAAGLGVASCLLPAWGTVRGSVVKGLQAVD